MKNQVFLIGPPFSGIHLVRQIMLKMGVHFSTPAPRIAALSDLSTEILEKPSVQRLNEEILEAAECSWFNVASLPDSCLPEDLLDIFEETLVEMITSTNTEEVRGIADFQTTLTFPIWEKYASHPLLIVLKREKAAVMQALQQQYPFSNHFCQALTEYYEQKSHNLLARHDGLLISYEQLLSNSYETVAALHQFLQDKGIVNLHLPTNDTLQSLIKSFAEATQNRAEYAVVSPLQKKEQLALLKEEGHKITELGFGQPSYDRKLAATLFGKGPEGFDYTRSIPVINEDIGRQKTLVFNGDMILQDATEIKIDLVDTISLVQIQAIQLVDHSRGMEISLPLEAIQSNARFHQVNWFFFDRIPSSISFTLPGEFRISNHSRIRVHFLLAATGLEALKYLHLFSDSGNGSHNQKTAVIPENQPKAVENAVTIKSTVDAPYEVNVFQLESDREFFRLELEREKNRRRDIESSLSYRAGRMLTFPARMFYDLFFLKKKDLIS